MGKKPSKLKRVCLYCWPVLRLRVMGKGVARWKRYCVRALIGVPLIFVATVVIVTQTPIMGILLLPRMSAVLGMEIRARRVYVARNGRLVLLDVEVLVPGETGMAGRFVEVERLDARVKWWPTLLGDPTLTRVVATSPLVRVSQSVVDGSLNVGSIPSPARGAEGIGGGGGDGTLSLPELVVRNMTLEIGEHGPGEYRVLKRVELTGALMPTGERAEARYEVMLSGPPLAPGGEPLSLTGSVDPSGLDLELSGLALHDWSESSIPSPMRATYVQLGLRGQLERTEFKYEIGKGVTARIVLRDGEMNLPIEPDGSVRGADPELPLRVTRVNGSVTFTPDGLFADADGLVGDLACRIRLDVDGFELESPFTLQIESRGFALEANPDLLPYAPPVVRERLRSFSNPTGVVDAKVVIARGRGDENGPGAITYHGEFWLREGRAAFAKVPYRFENLSAHVRFDQDRIEIVEIKGTAPTGATVFASGWIAPLNDSQEVVLDILVDGVPTDEVLVEALGEEYGPIFEAVLDRAAYNELLDRGLVITRQQHAEYEQRLGRVQDDAAESARLRGLLSAPVFEFGGLGAVKIHLRRPPLEHTDWDVELEISMKEGGVLPEAFPMPFIARDVDVWTDLERVEMRGGSFEGLTGGTAEVSLVIDVTDGFRPDIRVDAVDVPLDELLFSAIPDDNAGLTGGEVLRGLGVGGRGDVTVHVVQRENGAIGFDAHAVFESVRLSPRRREAAHGVWSRSVRGEVRVSERELDVHIEGELERDAEGSGEFGPIAGAPAGRLVADSNVRFAREAEGVKATFTAHVSVVDGDVRARYEDLVGVFSLDASERIMSLRRVHEPTGRMSADVDVFGPEDGVVETVVRVRDVRDAEMNLLEGRFTFAKSRGSLTARLGPDNIIEFDGFEAEMEFDGTAGGTIRLGGIAPVSLLAGQGYGAERPEPFVVEIMDGRFESPFSRRGVERFLSERTRTWYKLSLPIGDYGLLTRITESGASGVLKPSSLTYVNGEREARFDRVEGVIRYSPLGGTLEGVRAYGPGWSISAEGEWHIPSLGSLSLTADYTIDAVELTDQLRGALPPRMLVGLEAMSLEVKGLLAIDAGTMHYSLRPDFLEPFVETTASGRFKGASLLAGVEITECEGTFETRVSVEPDALWANFDMRIEADRLLVSGVTLTDARARVTGDSSGLMELTEVSGASHGGTLTAEARIQRSATGPAVYVSNIRLADMRMSPLLEEIAMAERARIAAEAGGDGSASPGVLENRQDGAQDRAAAEGEPDRSRGMLEGGLTLGGVVGDPSTRRGTGRFRVAGGRVISMPGLVMMIEVINLRFPGRAMLDYASLEFFVDGDTVGIEDLSIYSKQIKLRGFGSLDWPSREVDMHFFSGAATKLPILGDLLNLIQESIVAVSVKGKLGEQTIALDPFTSSRNPYLKTVHVGRKLRDKREEENSRAAAEEPGG